MNSPPTGRTGPPPRKTGPTITTVIVTRRLRDWRVKKHARRELDNLLGSGIDPWNFAEPIDWHATYLDRGVPERDHRGRELALARWSP